MTTKETLSDFEEHWKVLLQQGITTSNLPPLLTQDPFDCSSLQVPPLCDAVEPVMEAAVEKWRHLDERKIAQGPKWYQSHIRLPMGFDYETRQAEPPKEPLGTERVIDLHHPTATLDYATELWKILKRVPTAEELEAHLISGMRLPHTQAVLKQLDDRSLYRLRMSDRHQLPPPMSSNPVPTMVVELWRRPLKRSSTPDSARCILEFLGYQTLEDVHRTIVELLEDHLWTDDDQSGLFAIEDRLYTIGNLDYASSIQTWLQHGSAKPQQLWRRQHLGLATSTPSVQSMVGVRLDSLPMRLGVPYVHQCHGDVECRVMLTDRRLAPQAPVKYPLLHDIWTWPTVDCQACQEQPASFATSTLCALTKGHQALCHSCAEQLRVPASQLMPYHVWRNQAELSVGAKGPV